MLATSEPYVEYKLSGFTDSTFDVLHEVNVGVSTLDILSGLSFDIAIVGRVSGSGETLGYYLGGKVVGVYGTNVSHVKVGVNVDVIHGFQPFLLFRLSFPVRTPGFVPVGP